MNIVVYSNDKNTKIIEELSSLDEFETSLYSKGDGVAVTRRK